MMSSSSAARRVRNGSRSAMGHTSASTLPRLLARSATVPTRPERELEGRKKEGNPVALSLYGLENRI